MEFKLIQDKIFDLHINKSESLLTKRGENFLIELQTLLNQRSEMLEMLERTLQFIDYENNSIFYTEVEQIINEFK